MEELLSRRKIKEYRQKHRIFPKFEDGNTGNCQEYPIK